MQDYLNFGSSVFYEHFQLARKGLERISSDLYSLEHEEDLFPNEDQWFLIEDRLSYISSQIRDIKFVIANLYAMGSYQAVGGMSSKEMQMGVGQFADADLETIYARYDFDPKRVELFFNYLIEKPEGIHSDTLFFASGMASITTALAYTKNENASGSYLFGSNLYFENTNQSEHLEIEKRFQDFRLFDEMSHGDLQDKLKTDPQFIFVEPVGNNENMPTVDLAEILKNSTIHDKRIVMIDNTICGTNLDTKNIFKDLDDNTVVLMINSLQKLYEEGDDVASAGMITVLSKDQKVTEQVYQKLKALRGMLGTNITPYHLKLIQTIDLKMIKEHVHKIGENVAELSSYLLDLESPLIERVVTSPIEKDVSQAAFFYLHFVGELGDKFINKIIEKAKQKNIQVVYGASFGFKNIRMMVIQDQHYVRICPGTENPREVAILKEIFCESLQEIQEQKNGDKFIKEI